MEKLTEIVDMGGYAAYVWPAFAITFAVLLGMAAISLHAFRKASLLLTELQRPASRHET